jgi:hypothetical protein
MRQIPAATALGALLLVGFGVPGAVAGPCSQQISQLEKTLSSKDAGSGPVSTGNASPAASIGGQTGHPAPPHEVGTQNGEKTGPTKSMNQASSQTATSAQDVRRQQQGEPTAANATGAFHADDRTAKIEAALQRARQMDSQNNADCKNAVNEAQQLESAPRR